MLLTNILLLSALGGFALAWWMRAMPFRPAILLVAALIALGAGITGVLIDRWQAAAGAAVAVLLLLILLVNRLRQSERRTERGPGAPFVSGPIITLLTAGAATAIWFFPVDPLPVPSGPHPVGVRTFELADASRTGVLGARPDEPRRLLVRVWYPAGEVSNLSRAPYFTRAEAHTTARSLGELVNLPFFFTHLRHVRTNSFANVPPSAERNLPVVIYSHGYTSYLGQNTALMEHLASHGYLVVSVQHPYDSAATLFPNGDVAPYLADDGGASVSDDALESQRIAIGGGDLGARLQSNIGTRERGVAANERITQSALIWTADRLFLHDALAAGDVPADVADIIAAGDFSRVGEMGMSFGGATAGSICMIDARCAAGINLDGGDFHFRAFNADMPVPFLMFHSDMAKLYEAVGATPQGPARGFNEFSYERIAEAGLSADVYRVQLRGSRHLGFSDSSRFIRMPLREPLFGSTPSDVMIGAQNDFVRGFFDRYLRATDLSFPQAQLDLYGDWIIPTPNADLRDWWLALPETERAAYEARIEAARPAPH